ncbi:MAG: sulfatase [Bacteroidota bacterium]
MKLSIKLFAGLLIALLLSSCASRFKPQQRRPNILFAIADDQSFPHTSAYGTQGINTPAFDEVAKRGVLFTNAFVAAPQCSPSRAAILTGKNIWQLEEAGTHASYFPKIPVFTEVLEANGYHLGYTGKAWGPGNWKDAGWERNPVGPGFNDHQMEAVPTSGIRTNDYFSNFKSFLEKKNDDQPFFFWYGGHEPHRDYEYGSGRKNGQPIDELDVPAFLPDNEVVRNDVSDYLFEIEWFDSHLGKMMNFLKERGELNNTIIVVTADNGMPFPYAKANLQEFGTHVPLAICWPDQMRPDRVVEDLVSLIDLAPTFLDLLQLQSLSEISGRSMSALLLDNGQYEPREYVLTGRERHTHARPDNLGYPVRAIHSREYLYVRNLDPTLWPAGDPVADSLRDISPNGDYKALWPGYHDIDDSPTKMLLLDEKAAYLDYYELAYDKRPPEQLYHIAEDPFCVNNLANNPDYADKKAQLRSALESRLTKQADPRMFGNPIFDSYPRISSMREFEGFKKRGEYNPAFIEQDQKLIK